MSSRVHGESLDRRFTALRAGTDAEVRFDTGSRAYSTDGSDYRHRGGTGRRALHLAEAQAVALDGPVPSDRPERLARRPAEPSGTARWATTAAAGTLAAALGAVGRLRRP
ncbi:hypothetical protein [Streptomyces sp. Ag109_O5-10]|uniref:hypothetical protein n=1 Tax=Streptomyces sp. Ag109_O5-10 TaxID=1855349 RepID=UPI000894AECE|nr:hypothetical protein SAMN05216533_8115 [Streptomyces sp. Ag109_O5-10]